MRTILLLAALSLLTSCTTQPADNNSDGYVDAVPVEGVDYSSAH